MRLRLPAVGLSICCTAAVCAASAYAQDAPTRPAVAPAPAASPGRDLVAGKCFQCHTDSMFRDGRTDRLGWEASIYRMIGRGGQYTTEEIKQMADYLGSEFGPHVKPASAAQPR
jgi:mono/diheme cytochrome c family protein